MASWFWLNIPLAALFFLAICGIPVWLVLRRPDTAPDYSEFAERLVDPAGVPLAAASPSASDAADARLPEHGRNALSLVACPECGLAAEIGDRFSQRSTDGPVDHVVLNCVDGHYFRMPSDRLPADVHVPVSAGQAGNGSAPESKSGPGLSRLPGRLGVVGNPGTLDECGAASDQSAEASKDGAPTAASSAVNGR
jgi:hypothetical protein